jgi:hypothetical protein
LWGEVACEFCNFLIAFYIFTSLDTKRVDKIPRYLLLLLTQKNNTLMPILDTKLRFNINCLESKLDIYPELKRARLEPLDNQRFLDLGSLIVREVDGRSGEKAVKITIIPLDLWVFGLPYQNRGLITCTFYPWLSMGKSGIPFLRIPTQVKYFEHRCP